MLMGIVGARFVGLDRGGPLGRRRGMRPVRMGFAPVHQLAVLGAAGVLDQEHVAAARTLQEQAQKPHKRARAPNHGGFYDALADGRHLQAPSMS